jgi:hypothetical protein
MWVFDGDSWINEDASTEPVKRPADAPRYDMFYPELQVVEITPVVPRVQEIPPHPLP